MKMMRWLGLFSLVLFHAASLRGAEEPGRIEGIIGSAAGPVSNAWVFVYSAAPREGAGILCPTCHPDCVKRARTDAEGKFTIEPVDPKLMFRLLVQAKGYRPDFIRDVDPLFGGAHLSLKPLKMTNMPIENRVTGKLIDFQGKPVIGARIDVQGTRYGQYSYSSSTTGKVDPMAVTDENGEFFLDCTNGLDAITVEITAHSVAKRRMWLDTGKAHFIRMTAGVAVTGRLMFEGKPVAGVSVSMNTEDRSSEVFMRGFDVATDSEGRFTLSNIPPNNRFVLYSKMKDLTDLGASLSSQRVTTGADGSSVNVGDLKLGTAYYVKGRIVTSDGKPLPSRTRVSLSLEDAWDNQEVRADDDGNFQFLNVPAESVSIYLRLNGYRISAKNPSKDWLNEGRIVGRLTGNIDDFIIHLEKGNRSDRLDAAGDEDRQPRDKPLRGAKL